MDVKEQLRAYLEQRREMGESELTLDSMPVDEVMRIIGMVGKSSASSSLREAAGAPARAVTSHPSIHPSITAPPVRPMVPISTPSTQPAPEAASSGSDMAKAIQKGIVVGASSGDLFEDNPIMKLESLEEIAKRVAKCRRCPLYETATNPVPGEGNPKAKLVCVGEAPGADEDASGRPFIGRAGQLLTKILAAVELTREEVFICNVLKHRPPGNRNPLPKEVEACSPYLIRQLELIRPKVILAFGTFAAQTLLQTNTPIGKLRGSVHRYYGTPLVVTYHPAALLRNPGWKRPTWEDVKLARSILDGKTKV